MTTFRADRLAAVAAAETDHPWFVARRAMIEGLVRRDRAPRPGTVVDVGGGTGRILATVASAGDRALCVDLLAGPGNQFPGTITSVRADAGALPLPAKGADVVLCCDVLEHLADDASAAAELARVLAPDGVAIVTVPAHSWLWSFRDVDAGHVRRYSRSQLEAVLQSAGLQVTQLSWFAGSTLPAVAALRLAGRRWHGTRDAEERVGGGVVGQLVGTCLAAEARAVVRGRGLPLGSSIVAVARQA